MEIKTEVKTYRVSYQCDKCGKGEMLQIGRFLMSDPPKFEHKCNKCGGIQIFTGKQYPVTICEPYRKG